MKSFSIALSVVITSLILIPLTALAQARTTSVNKPAAKPPAIDFDPPRNVQIQISDDGPVVRDYRSVPQAPVIQEAWKQSAFADLWNATWKRSADLRFVISKLGFNDESKAIINQWLVDLGTKSPQREPRLRPEVRPPADIDDESTPFYSGKLQQLTKSGHVTSEFVALVHMVDNERENVETAFKQYISDDKDFAALARPKLLQMAGPEAMERLDRAIAENASPLKVGQPCPNGLKAPHVFPEKLPPFRTFSDVSMPKGERLMNVGDFEQSF
jgi:hypothetical protein